MVITYYCVTNTIDSEFCKQTTYISKFDLSQDFSIVTDLKLRRYAFISYVPYIFMFNKHFEKAI